MAEGTSNDSNSWESWLGGWVQTAKEKSNTAYEFVKKDLAEFSSTLQKETEKAIEKTSSSLTRENTEQATTKVKAGISSFLGNISKALVIPPSDDYVPVKVSADGKTLYDRGKARLHAIQLDASTYVDPPQGAAEQFEMWLNSFDMDQYKGEISEILVSKVEVRALYTKLVPNEVSHAEFWQRYFYRVHQLQCDEARKQALMQRADQTNRDSLSWDDDDWSGGEDDEGNQSDWEKMAKPQQQQPVSSDHSPDTLPSSSTSRPNDPCPSLPHSSTDESQPQDPTDPTNNVIKQYQHQSHSIRDSVTTASCDTDSTSFSTKADSELETFHNHFSVDSSHSSKADASEEVTEPEADQVSHLLNVSTLADTASACTSVEQVSSPENTRVPEPGSPAEISGICKGDEELRNLVPCGGDESPGASSAAAASGVELPSSSNEPNTITGDAACGASDVLSSPSSSSTIPCENEASVMLEASPASKDISHEEAALPLAVENQDECTSSDMNAGVVEVAEPKASSDLKTVDDDNKDMAMRVKGDMVVVGETDTPSSDSSEAKGSGLGDDWDEDFDVEVTEEDLKAAEDIARRLGENLDGEDDWENWD